MDKQEIQNSVIRSLISSIPIPILGPALTEMFDFRSKLKQNRLNNFVELLENYISDHRSINLENFQTEEFGDLFESVLKRIVQSKSDQKLEFYKNVLINQLNTQEFNIDYSEIFLDLIEELNIIEIRILKEHDDFKIFFSPEQVKLTLLENSYSQKQEIHERMTQVQPIKDADDVLKIKRELEELLAKIQSQKDIIAKLQAIKNKEHYCISDADFLFYKQRLLSKGLLIDAGIGAVGNPPFRNMKITEFGSQFIKYILT